MMIKRGKNNLPFVLALVVVMLGITGTLPRLLQVSFDEGVEIIRKKGYEINDNVVLSDYQAAGFKLTETSWNGFLQLCKRLRADVGALTICLDIEARIAFVYDPQTPPEEREIYYLKFPS